MQAVIDHEGEHRAAPAAGAFERQVQKGQRIAAAGQGEAQRSGRGRVEAIPGGSEQSRAYAAHFARVFSAETRPRSAVGEPAA